jgi:hypothetical protein
VKFRRFLRASENDFEGTRTTIPRVRDTTGQGGDGGALVCVHAGRGQDTCISEQYGGHTRASRVALRAWEECVEGDKAREPDGALLPGRASPAIVQMKTLASTV